MIERTFVMIKPDGVKRSLVGEILSRFEKVGLKVIGMKMTWVDEDFAKKHYTEDITIRRGEKVRNNLVTFLKEGPVIAFVLEGIEAIEIVRKMVGETESKSAAPGTIRGDYSHVSFAHADKKDMAVKNLIHASANQEDAKNEIALWFSVEDLYQYKTLNESHTLYI